MAEQLSEHFTLEEFTASETAKAKGIDNSPTQEHLANLRKLAAAMEPVRSLLGHPILISSGYRNPTLNKAVGGVEDSDHALGWAADFVCPLFGTPFDICVAIRDSGITFDQLIHEKRRWVHLSFNPRMRNETLTLQPDSTKYVPGILE
ncbi:MAG: D-Ala-D-Ala carboxypeptidase family metallohydrolase [Propylenella sp.]